MGASADNRLNDERVKDFLGDSFKDASEEQVEELVSEALDMEQREKMDFVVALDIVSGKSRKPYGHNRL